MEFRKLTNEELEELKEEFIQYLVSNGVDADMWEKFKVEEPESADKLVEQFSQVILQKSLERIEYLEHRTPTDLKLFFCDKDKIDLIALKSNSVDLTNMSQFSAEDFNEIEVFTASKKYGKQRELELFEMTEKGCLVTDHTLYRLIKQMI